MKIRVIVPFTDKAFNDQVTRNVGDIIDTNDENFKCDEALAQERIDRGFCELIEEAKPVVADIEIDSISYEAPTVVKKPVKKGKKASKKK